MILRTHYSGQISADMDGKEVMLAGFAHEIRDLGGIAFLVLRDREGMAQITLVKKLLGDVLLIVGGGIRSGRAAAELVAAGADLIVTGTGVEKSQDVTSFVSQLTKSIRR